jgi:hypothetical protein
VVGDKLVFVGGSPQCGGGKLADVLLLTLG